MKKPGSDGYIYVIGAADSPLVKIGATRGPVAQRLRQIQTSYPALLSVISQCYVENDVHQLEKSIHAFLDEQRAHGEWFLADIDQAHLKALIGRAHTYLREKERQRLRVKTHLSRKPRTLARTQSPAQVGIFGVRLRGLRQGKGWTQQELEARCGVPHTTISRVESGTSTAVLVETLLQLADVFEVTCDYLLGGCHCARCLGESP
jgi:DNA-binding XRE family transcriptional regulator